jgi:hypothetical protein
MATRNLKKTMTKINYFAPISAFLEEIPPVCVENKILEIFRRFNKLSSCKFPT